MVLHWKDSLGACQLLNHKIPYHVLQEVTYLMNVYTSTSYWLWVLEDGWMCLLLSYFCIMLFNFFHHCCCCFTCSVRVTTTTTPKRFHWVSFLWFFMLPMNRCTDLSLVLIQCHSPFVVVSIIFSVFFFALCVVVVGNACNRWLTIAAFVVHWHLSSFSFCSKALVVFAFCFAITHFLQCFKLFEESHALRLVAKTFFSEFSSFKCFLRHFKRCKFFAARGNEFIYCVVTY